MAERDFKEDFIDEKEDVDVNGFRRDASVSAEVVEEEDKEEEEGAANSPSLI